MIHFEKEKQRVKKQKFVILIITLIASLFTIVILVSGIFKYKIVAIASNSMKPCYERGDAIIFEKYNKDGLEVGDIIAFKYSSIIITHRIVKVWKQNNEYYYNTKGDANERIDSFIVKDDQVLGKVDYVVKYIGLPSVIINEYFRKE